jgi:hypothetical protein
MATKRFVCPRFPRHARRLVRHIAEVTEKVALNICYVPENQLSVSLFPVTPRFARLLFWLEALLCLIPPSKHIRRNEHNYAGEHYSKCWAG